MSSSSQQTTVLGYQISEGVAKGTGKPYNIGKLYVLYPLSGTGVGGYMGAELRADTVVLRKLEGMQFPTECMIESVTVIEWGNVRQQIMSISPMGNLPKIDSKTGEIRK